MATQTKISTTKGTKFLYASAFIVLALSVASLVNHVLYFNTIVTQYVAQGYPLQEILNQLLPSQFLPGLFQSLALYMGLAAVLFGLGMVHHKLTVLTAPVIEVVEQEPSIETEVSEETATESVTSNNIEEETETVQNSN